MFDLGGGGAALNQKLEPCRNPNRAGRIGTTSPYYVSAAPIIQDLESGSGFGWSTMNDLIRKEKVKQNVPKMCQTI